MHDWYRPGIDDADHAMFAAIGGTVSVVTAPNENGYWRMRAEFRRRFFDDADPWVEWWPGFCNQTHYVSSSPPLTKAAQQVGQWVARSLLDFERELPLGIEVIGSVHLDPSLSWRFRYDVVFRARPESPEFDADSKAASMIEAWLYGDMPAEALADWLTDYFA